MRLCLFVLGLCLCVLSGCGGGGSSDTGNLRFMQASPDAPQSNLYVDGKLVSAGLGYGNVTGYISLHGGMRHVQVIPQSGASPILDLKVSVVSNGNQTLIETGNVAKVQSVLLTDTGSSTTTTTSSIIEGSVRVVNAALNLGSADVYVVSAGSSIAGVSPVATVVGTNSYTGYELVPVGAYEVFMTAPGTKNVFLDTGAINMTSDINQTVVVLDGASGGFTFSVLTDQ